MLKNTTLKIAVSLSLGVLSSASLSAPGYFDETAQIFSHYVTRAAVSGDVDNDGDADIFLINQNANRVEILVNDGSGNMTSMPNNAISIMAAPTRAALADLDGDGDLDAFVTYKMSSPYVDPQDVVFLNDGLGNFSDTGIRIGSGDSLDVSLGDIDNDGDVDAFVVSGNCSTSYAWCVAGSKDDRVWLNDGYGNFSLGQADYRGSSADADLGDVDGDGDLDILIGFNTTSIWNQLMLNDGSGNFTDSGEFFDFKKGYSHLGDLYKLIYSTIIF